MSEVAIHYAGSPLNGPSTRDGVRPGERVPSVAGQVPVGAGAAAQFALFAEPSAAIDDLVATFGDLVEADVRPALHVGTISLVRPDGYLACSAAKPDAIAAYLARIAAHADQAPAVQRAQHA
jgi:hypothetical protein